jgi:hypothetical protein
MPSECSFAQRWSSRCAFVLGALAVHWLGRDLRKHPSGFPDPTPRSRLVSLSMLAASLLIVWLGLKLTYG